MNKEFIEQVNDLISSGKFSVDKYEFSLLPFWQDDELLFNPPRFLFRAIYDRANKYKSLYDWYKDVPKRGGSFFRFLQKLEKIFSLINFPLYLEDKVKDFNRCFGEDLETSWGEIDVKITMLEDYDEHN